MSRTGLSIQSVQDGSDGAVKILRLEGYVDANTFGAFETALRGAVSDGARSVVIDARKLAFASSMAWGLLLSIHRKLSIDGGGVVVAGLSPEMSSVFRIMGLNNLLNVFPDPDAAAAALSGAKKK